MRPHIIKLTFVAVNLFVFSITFFQNSTKKILFLGNISTVKNPAYTYTASGNYDVKLIANKCSNKDSINKTITISIADITPPVNNDKQADIYPIPTNNELKIKLLNHSLVGEEFKIFSTEGRVVTQGVLKNINTAIKLQFVPSGIYVLKIGSNNKNIFKIIKQ